MPPAGVYLTAFSTRLRIDRPSALASPRTAAGATGPSFTCTPVPWASRVPSSSASRTSGSSSMRGRGISGGTAARDRSKRSSATRMSRSTSSRLETSTCWYSSGVRDARSATSIPPFSAVSGVRSSWAASAAKRRIWPEGLVEPREHAVERLGEPVQLVLGALPSDALVQVLGGDAAGRRRHLVDRSERLPRDDGAARGRQADPERDQDEQRLRDSGAARPGLGRASCRPGRSGRPGSRSTIGIVRIRTCSRSCVIVSKVLMPRRALA